jgi:signal transduction histidine kinase
MSLKKKLALGFLASAGIVALLSIYLYANFAEIQRETAFLELTDTIRSKTLQLRRHEKNYFLYAPAAGQEESRAIHAYLEELDLILLTPPRPALGRTASLQTLMLEYHRQFSRIETLVAVVSAESAKLRALSPAYARVSRLVEANFLDKPLEDVAYLRSDHALRADDQLVTWLQELDREIVGLRKTGEAILAESKELDRSAREKVDAAIRISRVAILVIYPLFLVVGFGTSVLITGGIVRRLRLLTAVFEEVGQGHFTTAPAGAGRKPGDEVDVLTGKFYAMEEQLQRHEEELLQSKKLAAIGTLAAGVAHELNNPLNNISTTAQRLTKKAGEESPPFVRKGLDDIYAQTLRVKGIVSDLLEFARGREPHLATIELGGLVRAAWRNLGSSRDLAAVRLRVDLDPPEIVFDADREQLERVFINLFSNALEAMPDGGGIAVRAEENDEVRVTVTDTGRGIPPELLDKIFEPFYSSRDKGTGLGLAIVFNIVQKHHGAIRVASEVGRGTSFTIELPRHPGDARPPAGKGEAEALRT